MPKKIDLEQVKLYIPSFMKIKENTYNGKNSKAIFIDETYGEFEASPKEIMRGKLHHKRAVELGRNVKLTIEDIKLRLPSFVSIKENTYKNTTTKCVFIDDYYGEWEAIAQDVIRGSEHPKRACVSRVQTTLKKYGVEHTSKCPNIFSKMRKGMRKNSKINHWKTGSEIITTGSYEYKVVEWLNKNKIDFEWDIPFQLKSGTYFCDLYIIDQNLYVEIKGWWMQEISKIKWEEFNSLHPNSELWTKEILIKKGIIQ